MHEIAKEHFKTIKKWFSYPKSTLTDPQQSICSQAYFGKSRVENYT